MKPDGIIAIEDRALPLYNNAVALLRANLEAIQRRERVKPVAIGTLTDRQRDAINIHRLSRNPLLHEIVHEVVFVGVHIYRSRIEQDGYEIEDVVSQIVHAMAEDAEFVSGNSPMQSIASIRPRRDRFGNIAIRDQAVFECTARRPTAELFSVIPKGDRVRPKRKRPPEGPFVNE